MDKEQHFQENVLEKIKQVMLERVEQLSYQNVLQTREDFSKFFHYLEATNELPISFQQIDVVGNVQEVRNQELTTNVTNELDEEMNTIYDFERKVRGGVVLKLEGGYVIPEKMVRDMGIEHGDKVKIISKTEHEEKNSYRFEIIEKGKGPNPYRQEYKYCLIEKEAGELVVKEYMNIDGNGSVQFDERKNIRVDEVPFTCVIDKKDVMTFSLKEDDIIDIAFYKNNPISTTKVLHKHDVYESASVTVEQRRLNTTIAKKIKNFEAIEKEIVVDAELFKDRKILIVGCGSRKTEFAETFKNLNADLKHATGDEGKGMLSAMIMGAEAVVVATGENSHDATKYTIRECKKYNKAFCSTDGNGHQSILLCAEEALKRRMEKVS